MFVTKSSWNIVGLDRHNLIVYIEDEDGLISVTNDAENVRAVILSAYGYAYRVVYRDSQGEWWEIKDKYIGFGKIIDFERWHGLAWDILKR